ncbi:MAG: polyprenol monophosphomannose synthase [archaeon]
MGIAIAVIPTYNEADSIRSLLERLQQLKDHISRIIIVDDGSTDGTEDIVKSFNRTHQNIVVVQRGSKLGFGSAIRDGMREALKGSDVSHILQMDADLSHDTKYLSPMFSTDVDIVIGSRYVQGGGTTGWPLSRRAASRIACWIAQLLLRLPARDSTAGFKLYSRAASQVVVDESKENRSMGAFEIETIYLAKKHDLTVNEIPITFANREKGKSKAGLHEVFVVLRFVLSHILW